MMYFRSFSAQNAHQSRYKMISFRLRTSSEKSFRITLSYWKVERPFSDMQNVLPLFLASDVITPQYRAHHSTRHPCTQKVAVLRLRARLTLYKL